MEKAVFEFSDYKSYLREIAGIGQRKGVRLAMAKNLHCQPGYISQVLNGQAHFSLEQGNALCHFLGHGAEERHYFLLLLQKQRAGTTDLHKYFEAQLEDIKRKRMVLTERLGKAHQLKEEDRAQYYSSWLYVAIHIALSIPTLQEKRALSDFFQMNQRRIGEIIEFLVGAGLVAEKPVGGYQFGPTQIRIGNDSHHVIKHHTNWRNRAIESLEREDTGDLHYSGVFTLSQKDASRVKDRLLEEIKACQNIIRDSPSEKIFAFNMDFFNLKVKLNS